MKRILDILLAGLGLLLLFPLFIMLVLRIRQKLGSPVMFTQERIGLGNNVFTLLKFRSMTSDVAGDGSLRPDSERLTQFGKTLRATSLDELPSLVNVIKGEMSLVGPRPLLPEYLPLYSEDQIRRHDVRPGITGWAQINGRNNLQWPEKFMLDVWYVDNKTFWLDIKIIFMTVSKVLQKEGIHSEGDVTMKKFTGN